jgi:hypothetical protein
MNACISFLATLGITMSLGSCARVIGERILVERDSEMGRKIEDLDRTSRGTYSSGDTREYQAVAESFVAAAAKGDVDRMLSLTSSITLKKDGRKMTEEVIYGKWVVSFFKDVTVKWDPMPKGITDKMGKTGVVVSGRVSGDRSEKFHLILRRESGKICVTSIHRNP